MIFKSRPDLMLTTHVLQRFTEFTLTGGAQTCTRWLFKL